MQAASSKKSSMWLLIDVDVKGKIYNIKFIASTI
jgi:hypothetical protein